MSNHATLDASPANEVALEDPSFSERDIFWDSIERPWQPYYRFWLSLKSIAIQGKRGSSCQDDDPSADTDAAPPPLRVKLTVLRLLNVTTILSFGISKAVLTYQGQSTAATTLDWIGGTLLAVFLYCAGLYEERHPKILEWFFQVDLAPRICYCFKRFIGGVVGSFFYNLGFFIFVPMLAILLGGLALSLAAAYFPALSDLNPFLVGIACGVVASFCMIFPWCCTIALTRRVRVLLWAQQCAMHFVDDYGPVAPLENRYGWFGAVGTIVGILCGVALLFSPLIVFSTDTNHLDDIVEKIRDRLSDT